MNDLKQIVHSKKFFMIIGIFLIFVIGVVVSRNYAMPTVTKNSEKEAYWKEKLTDQQYYVLHQDGTDTPYTSPEMLNEKRNGTYVTADCGEPVFRSEQKYDSGTGWPSFIAPINTDAVLLIEDITGGMKRVEVRGKKCNTHLGHVFDDGPQVLPDGRQATGERYCINASALRFIPDEKQKGIEQ